MSETSGEQVVVPASEVALHPTASEKGVIVSCTLTVTASGAPGDAKILAEATATALRALAAFLPSQG